MEENTTKIIIGIIGIITAIVGGTIYYKKNIKIKKKNATIKGININGNNNKVIGGNDNSTN